MSDERRSIGVRVRPNSHDFIRQLRTDLAGKQYTFYADVRARTTKATGDVRKWAATDLRAIVGTVRVQANMGPATRDVAEWRRRQSSIKTVLPVHVDTSAARREIEALRAMARDITVRVKADTSVNRDGIKRAAVRSANSDMLDIGADNRRNRRIAKGLGDYVRSQDIGGALTRDITAALNKAVKSKTAKIDVDTTPARKTMYDLLNKFGGEQVDVEVDLDTTKADARGAELKRNLELRNVKLQADIDLRRVRTELAELRLKEKLKTLDIDVQVKKGATERVFESLRDMEKRFGNLTVLRSLDLGPLTLGKPTGLIGTLTTVTALAGAMPGAVTGLAALSDTIVRLAGAAALAPGALGALAASMATLSIGTSGVSDTFSAMFDMWTEGASKTNSYRNSVQEEAKAQREVGRARKEALGDLRDLNNELRGGVLNEAQALLDLQKARDRYAKGGFENQTDRLQAELDIKKAEQGVIDVRERNLNLQQKANDAQAKGVEGSDKVQDALAALAQAQTNGTTAQTKFNDALAQLSPNAQDFVKTIAGMKGEIFDFRNSVQDTIFAGSGGAIQRMFDNLAPAVEPGLKHIAEGLNQNLLQVFDSVQSPDGKSIIERILGGTAETQAALTNLINPLVKGVGTLVAAGSEHLPQVVNLMTRLADRFSTFIAEVDQNGKLDKFLDDGVGAMGDLAETGLNVIKIVNDLSQAFGGNLIKSLSDATGRLHEYLASAEGQAKINELMDKAKQIWEDWKPTLKNLPGIFDAMSDAARGLINTFGPFLHQFTDFMERNPELVQAFITGWLGAKVLTGVFSPLITLFSGGLKLGQALFTMLGKIPGVASVAAAALNAVKGVLPGGGNILTTPGTTAPIAGPGAAVARTGLGLGATFALPLAVAGGASLAMTSQIPQDYSVSKGDSDAFIKQVNDKIPAGVPKFGTQEAENFITGAAASGSAVGKWIDNTAVGGGGMVERAKRYLWLATQPNVEQILADPNFVPPPAGSYAKGGLHTGYTPWGAKQGKMAELHGGEYVEPKHVVDYYGVEAMKAVHQKRVPKNVLGSFEGGGEVPDLVYDPTTGQYVKGGTSISHGVNPALPGPGIIDTLANGASGIASSFGNSFASNLGIPGLTQTPGGGDSGWGPGGPPVGLGGGPDGFDIRRFGIGPGPVGSGPADWANFAGSTLGKFGSSFVTTLAGGVLDGLGLSGLSSYVSTGAGIADHFASANLNSAQGPGATQTNADVSNLLNTYGSMPLNPDYPGAAALPGVFDPASGTALNPSGPGNGGLQINTLRGKQVIQSKFPWATNIGGVRADNLKWHPMGLALDVMIPGAGGLNDPTPPEGKALGDQLYAWLNQNKAALGIDYILWQQKDHFNHLHVNFAQSGYPNGSTPPDTSGIQTTDPGNLPSSPGGWDAPGAPVAPGQPGWGLGPKSSGPIQGPPMPNTITPKNLVPLLTRDSGGPLPVGTSIVRNFTGKPELVLNHHQAQYVGSFLPGGVIPDSLPIKPLPKGPDAEKMIPRPNPPPAPVRPNPTPPPIVPASPPVIAPPTSPAGPPGPQSPVQGPNASPFAPSDRSATGSGPGEGGDHVHPALRKGITSGFATAGNLASMAINAAAAAGSFGASGALGAGGGGGGLGSMVSGLFQQAGKIANNVANVASSFLVGNITGGTTANPYGVTQRGSVPTGGSKVIDASSNQYGDVYTNDLDSYFKRIDRRNAQRAQSDLGRWGNQ